jgi:glyoxylase-like metal-dependent hydrolase (beta-lactamase superfamily II)
MGPTLNAKTAADRPRTTVGDFELTLFSDGTYLLDGGAFFGVVPKTLWSKRMSPDDRNLVACGTNCLLVRGGGQTVLVETGIGNKLPQKLKSIYNAQERLLDNLRAGGVQPETIDIVINSHLHFDHCGWNTVLRDGSAVATFPNARYYAPRGEWEHGSRQLERDRISYISDNYDPLIASGQMELLTQDKEIVPGIRVETFSGHTRHMQAIIIESRGQTACYISDLIPTSRHLDITWCMAYDLFPLETIENRKRYYSRALPERWLTIFTHDHETPWAYLEASAPGKVTVSGRPDEL